MMSQTAVLLYSSLATDQIQVVNSRRLEDVLKGNKVQFEKVDGSYPDNKDLRDILFGVSGQRGKYPQCFLKDESGSYTFVGLWEEVESLIECDTIPAEVLAANPQIKTFAQVWTTIHVLEYPHLITHLSFFYSLSGFRQRCTCLVLPTFALFDVKNRIYESAHKFVTWIN